jgi:hypothetical protein
MFKYNSDEWNYNGRLKHIYFNTNNLFKNSYSKRQIQITIFGIQILVSKTEVKFPVLKYQFSDLNFKRKTEIKILN